MAGNCNDHKDTAQKVIDMRRDIEEKRRELARLEGERDAILCRMQEEFGVDSLQELQDLVKSTKCKIQAGEEVIDKCERELQALLSDTEGEEGS